MKRLEKWSIKPSSGCNYCQSKDTIEHHLYQCKESKTIWDRLENWLYENIDIKLNLRECEILFGIPNAVNKEIELINFVIIITKWYINTQRSNDRPLFFFELLSAIRCKAQSHIISNKMNDRTNQLWQDRLADVL